MTMANFHDNGSQAGAHHWRVVVGEERDRDHMVRQILAGPSSAPAPSTPLVDPSSGGPGTLGADQAADSPLSCQSREDCATTVYSPLHSLQRGIAQSSGVGSVSVLSAARQRPPSDGGQLVTPAEHRNPACQGAHYVSSPSHDHRKPEIFLPPCSPQRSAAVTSLALRSPKRTISLDFPTNMDPRKMEEIHRHIIQMAHEAGMSDSVKIVEEHQEAEEEPIPIIHLQDPPKPKFKRQLSADTSPPHGLSTPSAGSDKAKGTERVLQGPLTHSLAEQLPTQAAHEPCGLALCHRGIHGEGGASYTSSTLSPKRLKSEHGTFSCTPPNSPVVRPRTTQGIDTVGDRRDAQPSCIPVASKQIKPSDVVHIFPQLGGGMTDNNNNSSNRTRVNDLNSTPSSLDNRLVDEADDKRHTEGKTLDVVSLVNTQQLKRADKCDKDNTSGTSDSNSARRPQESMQTLQMLFRCRGQTTESNNQHPSSTTRDTEWDEKSVQSETQSAVLDCMSQTSDRPVVKDPQTADKHTVQSLVQTGAVFSPCPSASSMSPSLASQTKTTPKSSDDTFTDSDLYMAELASRLQDMQRMIFSQHASHTDQKSAQREDKENETSAMISQGQTIDEERQCNKVTSASSVSSGSSITTTESKHLSATTTAHADLIAEEECRTARLCRSKSNPFTFLSSDIEKAKAMLDGQVASPGTTSAASQRGRQSVVCPPDMSAATEETQHSAPFRLGELWISSSTEGQVSALTTQRQLSDPGTVSKMNRVLDKVKPTALRQFSEPAKPKDQPCRQESGPSEFLKNPKQPGRSPQQQIRFRSENSEGFNRVEGHPTFFLRDEEKRANDMIWRNCATSQSPVLSQSVLARSPVDCFEVSRRRQSLEEPSPHERVINRDRGDVYWRTYKPVHCQPSTGEHSVMSSSRTPSPWQLNPRDRASAGVRPAVEDDSVFEEGNGPDRGSPFKNPAVTVGFGGRYTAADRSSAGLLSADVSPKRPALRSQSNVEQSPNKAELEAMAHYKYLRSFSEHISDPKRLMEQLRAMPPADCDQLLEQLQDRRRVTPSASFSSDNDPDQDWTSPFLRHDGHREVRRTLFQDKDDLAEESYSVAEWQQQGSYTYPPPLARRQSFSSAWDLRRSQSWIRDMESTRYSNGSGPRQPGDIDVTLECRQAISAAHQQHYEARAATAQHPEFLRMKIETYIQQILKNHLQIRPSGTSQADMDLWIAQAQEIERLTQEAWQLISTLSEHNRSVYDVMTGSVVIKVNCSTLLGVLDLWEKFESGTLQRLVGQLFGGDGLLAVTGLTDVQVSVSLCYCQYTACLQELGNDRGELTAEPSPQPRWQKNGAERPDAQDEGTPRTSPSRPPGDITAVLASQEEKRSAVPCRTSRGPTTTKRQGRGTSGDYSARRAFSELNLSDGELTPTSPTNRTFFDSVQKENSVLSSMGSPRLLADATSRWRNSAIDVTSRWRNSAIDVTDNDYEAND